MHIKNTEAALALEGPHGEVIYELIGHVAGGSEAYSLAEIKLPPGKASRRHYHPTAEESYYILKGVATVELDGETRQLSPGDAIAISPKKAHQIHNLSGTDLVFLAVCVPAWTPDNSVYLDQE